MDEWKREKRYMFIAKEYSETSYSLDERCIHAKCTSY